MPFLTEEDPNAKIKGSRDALGALPVWTAFGRHLVTNINTQSTSVRGFTIVLLGRHFAEQLINDGVVPREEALDVFLRMEQIGAYVRHVAHGVEGNIRGIERVKSHLESERGRVTISPDSRGRILSDQKVYGLWGLYSVAARTSGLIPEGYTGVTPESQRLLNTCYLPHLNGARRPLLKLLARGGKLDTRKPDQVFLATSRILRERFSSEEVEFYGRHLMDAEEVERNVAGRQRAFRQMLNRHTDLQKPINREEIVTLIEVAKGVDEGIELALRRIAALEAFIAPVTSMFDYVLTQHGKKPADVARRLEEHWGASVPNLDPQAFEKLLPEISSHSSPEIARLMAKCQESLATGRYADAIRFALIWNDHVMAGRKAGPWATLSNQGRIEVRYRGMERQLPSADELPTLWYNSYFIDALKSITLQLQGGR